MHDPKEKSTYIDAEEQNNHAQIAEYADKVYAEFLKQHPSAGASEVELIIGLAKFAYRLYCSSLRLGDVFSEAEARHLQMLAVAVYLEAWLDGDETSRQTIHSFAIEKYCPKRRRESFAYPPDDRRKSLERAAYMINTMQGLRIEQLKIERERWEQDQRDGKTYEDGKIVSIQRPRRGYQYSFAELRTFDLYSNGYLEVFRLLSQYQEVMSNTADKGSCVTLAIAYERYDMLFENATVLSSDKEYVVACMQIRKTESAYRFHLAAKLAKYIMDHHLRVDDLMTDSAKAIWGRYLSEAVFRPQDPFPLNEPYDVLYYDRKIECALQEECVMERAFCWRSAFIDVLDFMNLLKPIKKQAPWTAADFSAAARFFRNDFPVIESYVPVDVPQDRKAYFKNIQSIYKLFIELGDNSLKFLRDNMKHAVSERNAKKTET